MTCSMKMPKVFHASTDRTQMTLGQSVMTGAMLPLLIATTWPARAAQETESLTLEEVTVTATRREESLQAIPVSVAAMTGDLIQDLGLVNSQDLTAQMPGLTMKGPFNMSSPQIAVRGVGNNGFNANAVSTVGIYTDEIYINQNVAQGFQLFDLERVELLRGPQGTLYGVNTTSGALNFISKKPSEILEGHARVSYGNYNSIQGEGALNIPMTDALAARLAVAFNQRDGHRYNTYLGRDVEFYDNVSWRAQLAYAPTSEFDVLLRLHGSEANNDGFAYEQQGLFDPATFAPCSLAAVRAGGCVDFFGNSESPEFYSGASDVAGFEKIEASGAAITANWRLPAVTITSITAYEDASRDALDDLDGSPLPQLRDQYLSDGEQFSQEIRLTSAQKGRFDWIAGAYYFHETLDELTPFAAAAFGPGGLSGLSSTLEGVYRYFDSKTTSVAVFADATIGLTENTALRAGLRYTRERKEFDYEAGIFDVAGTGPQTEFTLDSVRARILFPTIDRAVDRTWSETTGRLAYEYTPSADVLLYTSIARGFRGGNINGGALFSDSEFSVVDPEFLDAVEVGTKLTLFNRRATLNAAAFYYEYSDQQVTTVRGGQQLLANAAKSTILGGEVELHARPTDDLLIQLGLAMLDTKYDEFIDSSGLDLSGNQLENAPELTFNGLLSYDLPVSAQYVLTPQTDFSYSADTYLDFSNSPLSVQEAHWIQNARLSLSRADKSFTVSAWVRNLWDEKYLRNWADLSGFGFNLLTTGLPRTYGIEISAKF
jgi:iron complex outermembrane recepter protein